MLLNKLLPKQRIGPQKRKIISNALLKTMKTNQPSFHPIQTHNKTSNSDELEPCETMRWEENSLINTPKHQPVNLPLPPRQPGLQPRPNPRIREMRGPAIGMMHDQYIAYCQERVERD
jgi:hypothetical protein